MSYKKLEIWELARSLVIDIHRMTMNLPKYGRRYYKQEFIKFLVYSIASNDETIDHLETLFETGSPQDENVFNDLHNRLEILGKKINNFIQSVKKGHLSEK
ncbi:MAG: four helix bundle protein [Bacteroidota bacterium]|nr:four helix bundle protein [Bacteroidota bacterium]